MPWESQWRVDKLKDLSKIFIFKNGYNMWMESPHPIWSVTLSKFLPNSHLATYHLMLPRRAAILSLNATVMVAPISQWTISYTCYMTQLHHFLCGLLLCLDAVYCYSNILFSRFFIGKVLASAVCYFYVKRQQYLLNWGIFSSEYDM